MEEKKSCHENCYENCRGDTPACIPFFAHENTVDHMSRNNKRLLIAMIVAIVVITIGFVVIGYMFLNAYNEREKGWQDIVQQRLTTTEVAEHGIHEQPDP